jgi:endonuclease/exonuclease/phosphatase (EEP) superfamily protein YafD
MTEVRIDAKWVEIGVVHLRWPWPASGPEQIKALEPRLAFIGADAIIAGDFNAATWSHSVQRFADVAGMTVATGFGGTWMYKLLPPYLAPRLGLPIDNAMAKGSVSIDRVSTLPAIGSDHLPLLIEFSVAADAQAD